MKCKCSQIVEYRPVTASHWWFRSACQSWDAFT